MSLSGTRTSGTRLLAAVVLSACVGLVGGGLGAWAVFSHFGPIERVITETKTGGGAVSVGDVAAAVQASLVTVSTQPVTAAALAAGTAQGLVQGFAVSSDGLVMTSAHAIRGATRLRVATADGHAYPATIAATDVADGLVLLRATGASNLSALRFATTAPRIGDLGIVVFHPPLGPLSARSGVVASVGIAGNDGIATIAGLVSLDAAPAPEADGAPLVDGTGSVLGVVTVTSGSSGVVAASGRAAASLLGAAQRGATVAPATFGVTAVIVGATTSAAAGVAPGALVQSVDAGGPAAGMVQAGDVITSVNGTAVGAVAAFTPAAFGLTTGDSATFSVTAPSGAVRSVTLTVAGG